MTRDDIIRLAKDAGFNQILATNTGADVWIDDGFYVEELENFAVLVAAEKEQQMIRDGWRQCAEGQRTTQHCGLLDAAVRAEREACAKVAEAYEPRCENCPSGVSNAILARGEI